MLIYKLRVNKNPINLVGKNIKFRRKDDCVIITSIGKWHANVHTRIRVRPCNKYEVFIKGHTNRPKKVYLTAKTEDGKELFRKRIYLTTKPSIIHETLEYDGPKTDVYIGLTFANPNKEDKLTLCEFVIDRCPEDCCQGPPGPRGPRGCR